MIWSKKDIDINYGELGENILIDFNLDLLEIGMKLKIGEVVLEIAHNCTICDHLSKINKEVPTLLKNDRGVFAKVVVAGLIKKGFEIKCI